MEGLRGTEGHTGPSKGEYVSFNYMAFPTMQTLNDGEYQPAVGHVVRVKTYAGDGMIAEIVADRRDGYELKYPSPDGLRILRKTVPHWVGLVRVEKTLVQVAAARFRAAGAESQFEAFKALWGREGLLALCGLTSKAPN